jgi:hypothetical protein
MQLHQQSLQQRLVRLAILHDRNERMDDTRLRSLLFGMPGPKQAASEGEYHNPRGRRADTSVDPMEA